MKKFLIRTIEKIHLRLFGHEMSDQMKGFLANLSWSFYAGIIATPISIVIGTLAGRYLGPEQYGNYNLVVLVSSYVIVVSFCGLDTSAMKRIVKAKTKEEQEKSFFSSFIFVTSMIAIISIIGLLVIKTVHIKMSLPANFILFVIIFTFLSAYKSILDILVRALEKFKLQAIVRLVEIATLSIIFLLAIFIFKKIDYRIYLGILFISMAVVSFSYYNKLKTFFRNFSSKVLKSLLSEGKYFMIGGILNTVFISSDRLLIAKYINVTSLGIYSAYYAASLGLIYTLSLILTNVLFPASAKSADKSFTKKIDQLFLKGFIPIFLFISLTIVVFFTLLGKAFPLKIDYLLLFAIIATLNFFQTVYNNIILDASHKRYVQYFYISNFINLITVVYYFVILKYISKSIDLVLIGLALNTIINIIIQKIFVIKMREEQIPSPENLLQE